MKRNHLALSIFAVLLVISAACQAAPPVVPTPTPLPAPSVTPSLAPTATATNVTTRITYVTIPPPPTHDIPFQLTEWYKAGTGDIRFILYLDDPSEANAVRFLKDGLMAELARSGRLHPGYPKFTNLSRYAGQRCDVSGRYAIQLSELPDNYFVLPLCGPSAQDSSMTIYLIRSGSLDLHFQGILYIGVGQPGIYGIPDRQEELIWQAFANLGLTAYSGR